MTELQCVYCSKTFSTKFNLKSHQTKTKYCIEIQKKLNLSVDIELKPCEYCLVEYDPKLMKRHLLSCKAKTSHYNKEYENRIKVLETKLKSYCELYEEQLSLQAKSYDEQIAKLKEELNVSKGKMEVMKDVMKDDHDCLLKLATQPKVTNNTVNNNNNKILNMSPLDMSQERLQTIIQSELTFNHGAGGQAAAFGLARA